MSQLGFHDRTGRVNLRQVIRVFNFEYFCVFFYTAGCQLDRVRSAQPVISVQEGERYKRPFNGFSVSITRTGGTLIHEIKT